MEGAEEGVEGAEEGVEGMQGVDEEVVSAVLLSISSFSDMQYMYAPTYIPC